MSAVHIAGGLVLAVSASACFEAGYVVQASESRAEAGRGVTATLLGRLVRRPGWLGGTALVLVGTLLQLGALAVAPVAIVQPTLVVGLALLVVLAERRLGEVVRGADRAAVAAAGVGAVLVALGGQTAGVDEPAHRALALGALAAVLVLAATAGFILRRRRALVLTAGAGDAWAVLSAKLAFEALGDGRPGVAAAWGAAAIAGALAGLGAEMAALQRLPATTVGPLTLAAQVAIPVLLAPSVVGERWDSAPIVLAGTALATAAAIALGRRRELLADGQTGGPASLGAESAA